MTGLVMNMVVAGVFATVVLDIWQRVLHVATGIPPTNWGMVGRWVGHLPGRVFHDAIGEAAPVGAEAQIGWGFHYAVGVVYGVALAAIMGPAWLAAPTFFPAWVFSILMVGFGWFLLQPGLGLGWAASKTPEPWKVRGLNLAAHTVFALGLWGGALF